MKILQTNQEVTIEFRNYGKLRIPKGTELTNQTASGFDKNYNFVADLSFIPYVNGVKQYGLIHDATYYGINIPKEYVETIEI